MDTFILCGGSGSRLFPISNNHMPKQFISVTTDNQTLLEKTISRLKIDNNNINLISNIKNINILKKYDYNYAILEPFSRNTAPAGSGILRNLYTIMLLI